MGYLDHSAQHKRAELTWHLRLRADLERTILQLRREDLRRGPALAESYQGPASVWVFIIKLNMVLRVSCSLRK